MYNIAHHLWPSFSCVFSSLILPSTRLYGLSLLSPLLYYYCFVTGYTVENSGAVLMAIEEDYHLRHW